MGASEMGAPHRLNELVKFEHSLRSLWKSAYRGHGLPIADYKSILILVSPICELLAMLPQSNANDKQCNSRRQEDSYSPANCSYYNEDEPAN
jgi:hypothetical protein